MDKKLSIAIDGPAAAGKSTVAKIVAEKKSYVYIDTGAMYRAITYTALKQNADLTDEAALTELLKRTEIELVSAPERQIVLVNGEDVTEEIRKDEVSNQVSIAAKHKGVREEMVKRQQITAPVKKGTKVGTLTVTYQGSDKDYGFLKSKEFSVNLVTKNDVDKANWFVQMMRGIGGFFSGIWNSAVDTVTGWF
ncbi:(d)CMP kinase [Bacillus paralicheniformis]|uniref:(d)CMP kinase n=1 Tax=Bacillus paralicheniformis TaxID=1648923 RepID=UPI0021A2CB42|nr:(d)CMP kinase [Bacillus paralicheniformis]UWS62502.1 (d)CMP kinase [Bacillus paralicheniformis]